MVDLDFVNPRPLTLTSKMHPYLEAYFGSHLANFGSAMIDLKPPQRSQHR